MKDKHIVDILEMASIQALEQRELAMVREHTHVCDECRRAYEAAYISGILIRERAAEIVQPSAFFQTRVLAAVREQMALNREPAFSRLWKAAGALVSSMALTTAALAAVSLLAPPSVPTSQEATATLAPYSAEAVVFDQNQGEDQLNYDQVLNTIYVDDDEAR